MTYTVEESANNLRAKIQRAIDEFHKESGGIYAPAVFVGNTQVATMGQTTTRYISMVEVELSLRNS